MPERNLGVVIGVAAAVGVAALLGLAVLRAQNVPDGPVEPAWDRAACAHCRMLIGDPAFAAQIHLESGGVLHFDDPGCLLLHASGLATPLRSIWFHHVERDAWLAADAVAFATTATTPMGYGLAAVDPGTAGSLDLEAARAHAAERDLARRGARP